MKKKRKKLLIYVCFAFLLVLLLGLGYFYFIYDSNTLNIREKQWISNNSSNVLSISVPANINNFSKDGKGLFYDYIESFEKDYSLTINRNIDNSGSNLGFYVSNNENSSDLLFYKDFYAIISKDYRIVRSINDLKDGTVGIVNENSSYFNSSARFVGTLNVVESKDALLQAIDNDTVKYAVVPLNEYLDEIIENNYKVIYQLETMPVYYYFHLGEDSLLNSILVKYYKVWSKERLEDSYYRNLFNLYVDSLSLTDMDIQTLTNKVYTFGFVDKAPYQILNSSMYGGITFSYLNEFSKLTNVEFDYVSYKNSDALIKAYNNKKLDLIFNDTADISSNVNTNISSNFYLINSLSDDALYANIEQIGEREVCVVQNTNLSKYLSSFSNLKLNIIKNEKKLLKCARNNKMVAIDSLAYNYYVNNQIKNSHIVYSGFTNNNYDFMYVNSSDSFFKIFSSYVNVLGYYKMVTSGIVTYNSAFGTGAFISMISKYVLIMAGIFILIVGVIITAKKNIKLNTRIKKDEKLKFVDMMTSLKNRNYLNEKMEVWNMNTIYPQSLIVIDLNNVKYLNDTFGHEEGDKQIMAAANVLHQNQLDNSEIMRTDGNEFMIYMVGYNEKQVVNYIKKLLKEFNNLPYEYGAAVGFSMIVDDLKLIDDAINEATIQMRENKEIEYNENK